MRSPRASSKLRTISSSVVSACAALSDQARRWICTSSGSREDRGVHVGIAGVNGANALFDMRFAEAGDAEFA